MSASIGNRFAAVALASAAGVLVSSCGTDHTPAASADQVARTIKQYSVPRGASIITYVLERDGSGRLELAQKEESFVRECLAVHGFSYPSLGYTLEQFAFEASRPVLFLLSVEQAEHYGYSDPTGNEDLPHINVAAERRNGYADTLDASDRATFDRLEVECISKSRDEIFTDFEAYEAARETLEMKRMEFFTDFESSDFERRLDDSWRDCMRDRGYTIGVSPTETRQSNARNVDAATLTQAVADARCRESTDYEDQYLDHFYAAETAFLLENEALVLTVYENRYGEPPPPGSQ